MSSSLHSPGCLAQRAGGRPGGSTSWSIAPANMGKEQVLPDDSDWWLRADLDRSHRDRRASRSSRRSIEDNGRDRSRRRRRGRVLAGPRFGPCGRATCSAGRGWGWHSSSRRRWSTSPCSPSRRSISGAAAKRRSRMRSRPSTSASRSRGASGSIDWADVRFAHRFAGGPSPQLPPRTGTRHAAHERREWLRHLVAWATGTALLGLGVLVVGDVDRTRRCSTSPRSGR